MFWGNYFGRAWPAVGVLSAVLLCGAVGCGSGEPFEMLPVSGKLIYEDPSLSSAARIEVTFEPQVEPIDPKTYPRPGYADVNVADGTFSTVTSHRYGDGLVIGKHKVQVASYDKNDTRTNLEVDPAEIEVGPDSTEFQFKVKRRP